MEAICIYGGNCLSGQTVVQGSKNAALPVLAATLLIEGTCEIENCPQITDVHHMLRLMESVGCVIERGQRSLRINTAGVREGIMPPDSVGVMRSSITLLGALLTRVGNVRMEYPGGCVIGRRPIDMHLSGLRKMGVCIREGEDGFEASTNGMKGAVHRLPFVSVGTTENLILAAVLAEGETVIEPAAREPEIQILCHFLQEAGARIEGTGSSRIVIRGVKRLQPVHFCIPADRIVAGTYLAAGMCAGGHFFLEKAPGNHMQAVLDIAGRMGVETKIVKDGVEVCCKKRLRNLPLVCTESYPGFPTDLQSPFLCAMALASGNGIMQENIFENRYRIVEDLKKMGADIQVQGKKALVRGVPKLTGAQVEARELRGGAAIVAAGAAAEGTTLVRNKHFIDRGYEDIVSDMHDLGVSIAIREV